MSLSEIMQFILLPAIAWLHLNFHKLDRRLTRIETQLEILLPSYIRSEPKTKKHHDQLRPTQLVNSDRP